LIVANRFAKDILIRAEKRAALFYLVKRKWAFD